jgi:hypothetical protein
MFAGGLKKYSYAIDGSPLNLANICVEELEVTSNMIHHVGCSLHSSMTIHSFSVDLSINGRMVISIQQRQQFAQIT